MRRINQMNEQKIIRLLQSICFYGTAILLYGFVFFVWLTWGDRIKENRIKEINKAPVIQHTGYSGPGTGYLRVRSLWPEYIKHPRLP